MEERQTLIDQYNRDPSIFLFLLSTRAGTRSRARLVTILTRVCSDTNLCVFVLVLACVGRRHGYQPDGCRCGQHTRVEGICLSCCVITRIALVDQVITHDIDWNPFNDRQVPTVCLCMCDSRRTLLVAGYLEM